MKNKSKNTSHISREELASLQGKPIKSTERSGDDFVNDSIEGWEELKNDFSSMEELDKRFMNSNVHPISFSKIIAITMSLVSLVLLIFIFLPTNSKEKTNEKNYSAESIKQLKEEEIAIESSDIHIAPSIEKMEEPISEKQISPQVITEDYTNQLKEDEAVSHLPVRPIENLDNIVDRPIPTNRQLGKEIYLRNFKALDYSVYRQSQPVETEQIILSGTPANENSDQSNTFSEIKKSTVEIEYMEYLSKTLHYFDQQNYKQTLTRCNIILSQYPNDVNAQFYKGICLYNFGEYQESIPLFKQCLINPYTNFDQESLWYLAQAYEMSDNRIEARAIYTIIVKQGGYYSQQAKERLK